MTPQVGQTVQYFEHGCDTPTAAIVTKVYEHSPFNNVDLAVWIIGGWDNSRGYTNGWGMQPYVPTSEKPSERRWQFIPATVRTEYPFKEGPFPPGPITVQTPPDDRSCSQSPFDPH